MTEYDNRPFYLLVLIVVTSLVYFDYGGCFALSRQDSLAYRIEYILAIGGSILFCKEVILGFVEVIVSDLRVNLYNRVGYRFIISIEMLIFSLCFIGLVCIFAFAILDGFFFFPNLIQNFGRIYCHIIPDVIVIWVLASLLSTATVALLYGFIVVFDFVSTNFVKR